jgi:hypothetical protein
MIICILDAGELLMPYTVTSKMAFADEEQLRKHRVHARIDLILKSNRKPYINAKILLNYIKIVFLPYLPELSDLLAFVEEIAVFLMENCSTLVIDDMIETSVHM